MLLDNPHVAQDSVEVEGIVIECFRDVGDAARTEEVEGKAAQTGEDTGVVTDAATVFPQADITDIVLAILDAPMPTYRLRIGLRTDHRLAVADVIGRLLGLAPLATLRIELIAAALDLDDGVNQPVPLGRQVRSGEDPHLTPLDALAGMVMLPMSAEGGGLTGKRPHLLQQFRLVAFDLNDEMVTRRAGDLEGFF